MGSHAPYATPHAAVAMGRCALGSNATPRRRLFFFYVSLSLFLFTSIYYRLRRAHIMKTAALGSPRVPRHVIHVTYRWRLSIACSEIERTTFRHTRAFRIIYKCCRDFMLAINPLRSSESSSDILRSDCYIVTVSSA